MLVDMSVVHRAILVDVGVGMGVGVLMLVGVELFVLVVFAHLDCLLILFSCGAIILLFLEMPTYFLNFFRIKAPVFSK
jgi:hypothetical protein